MNIYYFNSQIISGDHFDVENPYLKKICGSPYLVTEAISGAITGKTNVVEHSETGFCVRFEQELSEQEEELLNQAVSGYKNYQISYLENIHNNWSGQYTDYKQARQAIVDYVSETGFNNLSQLDKEIVCRWFATEPENIASIYNYIERTRWGKFYHENSVASRDLRFDYVCPLVCNAIDKQQQNQICSIMRSFYDSYVKFGQEGTVEGDDEGIFDYILGRSGTSYAQSGSGLANRIDSPSGDLNMTWPQLADNLMKVLKSGIY